MKSRNILLMTAGILLAASSAEAAKQCLPCEPGKWGADGKCDQGCPAGYYCAGGHKMPCPPGYYCPAGSPNPLACPAGRYNNQTGQTECKSDCATLVPSSPNNGLAMCPNISDIKAFDTGDDYRNGGHWTCINYNLGPANGYGYDATGRNFNDAARQPAGYHCHCRANIGESWSSWVWYVNSYVYIGHANNCWAGCAYACANDVGRWFGAARW
ncbi:MAG: hypothetical protein LBI17_01820 [Rickettsiales bacterium]|jgi:hypothetical protein|nr:hypothetical protein [Rickettsiales bacterium]